MFRCSPWRKGSIRVTVTAPADLGKSQTCPSLGLHCGPLAAKNYGKVTDRLHLVVLKGFMKLPLEQTCCLFLHQSCLGIHVLAVLTFSLGIRARISFECISEHTVKTMLSFSPIYIYPQHSGLASMY